MRSARESADLTARAQIRNAALRLFADLGPDAVGVRQIAAAAGCSPALVLHHFGSKAGLREAVDRFVAEQFDSLLGEGSDVAEVLASGAIASIADLFRAVMPADSPLAGYLRRLLLTSDPVAVTLFRRWFEVSRTLMNQMIETGVVGPTQDPDVLAAFLLAADLNLLILREPITEAIGADPLSDAGMLRWAGEVTRLYRDGLFAAPPPPDAGTPDEKAAR